MKKRKLFLSSVLGVGVLALSMICLRPSDACIISNPTGVAFENSYNDISKIHNRLVDEDIIGYNVYNLYTFYDYIDGKWQLDHETLDSFNTYTDKLHGDYIIVSSLDGSTDNIKESAFKCLSNPISTNYESLKKYSSFKEPLIQVKNLSSVFDNFSIYNNLIVGDVASFGSLTNNQYSHEVFNTSDSDSIATAKEVIKSIYIIEYVQRSYGTGYDNEILIQNDSDVINEGVTFAPINQKIQIKNGEYILINDSKYTYNQIKNMFSCYDGRGNKTDIYRDLEKESELRAQGKEVYNELDLKVGISYMCLMGYGVDNTTSSITIRIETYSDNILDLIKQDDIKVVSSTKENLTSSDLINLACKVDGNCTKIVAYAYVPGEFTKPEEYTIYSNNVVNLYDQNQEVIVVFSNFDGELKTIKIQHKQVQKHWYDWILKAITKFINWLAGD